MQSRSIDSYVHAIHAMQPFDIGDINFADPVAELQYEHHVESTYPNFTLLNCESCHNPGTYKAPSHAKSLPGVLSKNDTVAGPDDLWCAGVATGPAAQGLRLLPQAFLINESFDGTTTNSTATELADVRRAHQGVRVSRGRHHAERCSTGDREDPGVHRLPAALGRCCNRSPA